MNWKFWTGGTNAERGTRNAELNAELQEIMERLQQPVGKIEEAQRKIREGLGGLSETHPGWQAVQLLIEWQRREAHADTMVPFANDRDAWLALGREQGIERVQMALVRAFVETRSKE